jgi:hypothetical protein
MPSRLNSFISCTIPCFCCPADSGGILDAGGRTDARSHLRIGPNGNNDAFRNRNSLGNGVCGIHRQHLSVDQNKIGGIPEALPCIGQPEQQSPCDETAQPQSAHCFLRSPSFCLGTPAKDYRDNENRL